MQATTHAGVKAADEGSLVGEHGILRLEQVAHKQHEEPVQSEPASGLEALMGQLEMPRSSCTRNAPHYPTPASMHTRDPS